VIEGHADGALEGDRADDINAIARIMGVRR